MGFAEAVRSGFGNYANFAGRAARPAYWWWTLFGVLVGRATRVLDGLLGSSLVRTTLYGTEVPLGAVTVLVGLALLLLCFIRLGRAALRPSPPRHPGRQPLRPAARSVIGNPVRVPVQEQHDRGDHMPRVGDGEGDALPRLP
jgi:hypothetical protein